MTSNLDKISNLIQWQLDRGLTYGAVSQTFNQNEHSAQQSAEEYPFLFLVESTDFKNSVASEMLHKIISALKIPESGRLILCDGQLNKNQLGKIHNALLFGNIIDLPQADNLLVLPSLSDMLEKPELKIGAWEKMKSLSF